MSDEPDSLILKMLRQMRTDMATKGDIADVKEEIATVRTDIADVRSDMHSLRADLASDMLAHRKETSGQISGLRRAVIEYHSSVIGHGILISELEARVRRMEQHLNLPSMDVN